ncbi:N-acetyltransferase [Halosquirtibacter xylanolyticus]|uniref:GNAT family N-acetyltransferase n=1 Tax=Halosquirtibacter xylanolyticus TaxID=3374599 RepID=UPI00374A7F3D|nr:N-acetyltransferase [Prolixibacteraceae bacterium]
MKVIHENDVKNGFLGVEADGERVALMTYTWAGDKMFIIDHTEVSEDYGHKGFGMIMVESAVEFARAQGVKIYPLCPFAKHIFDTVRSFDDVL